MNKSKQGAGWEEAAAIYLTRAGVNIRARNYRCSRGEVDIIGFHRGCLVFFEVKYRSGEAFGLPEEAVDGRKQSRICRCADVYLYQRGLTGRVTVRFDVVAVCRERIRWIENAFDYRENRKGWR